MMIKYWFGHLAHTGGTGEAEERESTRPALERPAESPDDAHHSWRCSILFVLFISKK